MYDAFAEMLDYGSKDIRYQLNVPDPDSIHDSKLLCDGESTLDATLRKARTRALAKRSGNPVILVRAWTRTVDFDVVCEVIRNKD